MAYDSGNTPYDNWNALDSINLYQMLRSVLPNIIPELYSSLTSIRGLCGLLSSEYDEADSRDITYIESLTHEVVPLYHRILQWTTNTVSPGLHGMANSASELIANLEQVLRLYQEMTRRYLLIKEAVFIEQPLVCLTILLELNRSINLNQNILDLCSDSRTAQ